MPLLKLRSTVSLAYAGCASSEAAFPTCIFNYSADTFLLINVNLIRLANGVGRYPNREGKKEKQMRSPEKYS